MSGRWTNRLTNEQKRQVANARSAKSRRDKLARIKDNPHSLLHGTFQGYDCGCRCEPCMGAMRRKAGVKNPRKKPLADGDES